MPSYISGESLFEFMMRHESYDLERLKKLYEGETKRNPDDENYRIIYDTIVKALEAKKK